jgi:hypothetical protein
VQGLERLLLAEPVLLLVDLALLVVLLELLD